MSQNLKELYKIQFVLESSGYKDTQRISQDILEFTKENNHPLEDILSKIESNIPWEYIKGYTEFIGKDFKVTEDTLIPRIESEDFVNYAIQNIKEHSTPFKSIIDVGTGSGCLIISIYDQIQKDINFIATDISEKALNIAKKNAENILGEHSINFIQTDLIEDVFLDNSNKPILFLANLPYIPTKQLNTLDESVIDNEPILALDGGEDGLMYYKKLFEQILDKKLKDIEVLIEIEPTTLENCKSLIMEKFPNSTLEILKDFREQERFILIRFF